MAALPGSLMGHRVYAPDPLSVVVGNVRWAPVKSIWFTAMSLIALVGGVLTFTWSAFLLYVVTTGVVLLFGHSLGSHRKFIHNSYQCPRWLERLFVWLGVQVGLAGPLGLLRQHELRDYAQRLPDCHPYLRHGRKFWVDAWWQLHCDLHLANPPELRIEEQIANDLFYRLLERTWILQQLPVALLFYAWGGWAFVIYGVCARVATGVFGHWFIGYFAHNRGAMHHEVRNAAVQGHNVSWTSLLTMGECWHNNHHAFPGSAKLGLYQGEWDPGWWALRALEKLGLVWKCTLPADLPARPELVRLPVPVMRSMPGLSEMLALLAGARQGSGELIWPGKRIGAKWLRFLVARGARITLRPESPRLLVKLRGQSRLYGLPALLIAIASGHGALVRALAVLAMPFAVAHERLRTRCGFAVA